MEVCYRAYLPLFICIYLYNILFIYIIFRLNLTFVRVYIYAYYFNMKFCPFTKIKTQIIIVTVLIVYSRFEALCTQQSTPRGSSRQMLILVYTLHCYVVQRLKIKKKTKSIAALLSF